MIFQMYQITITKPTKINELIRKDYLQNILPTEDVNDLICNRFQGQYFELDFQVLTNHRQNHFEIQ